MIIFIHILVIFVQLLIFRFIYLYSPFTTYFSKYCYVHFSPQSHTPFPSRFHQINKTQLKLYNVCNAFLHMGIHFFSRIVLPTHESTPFSNKIYIWNWKAQLTLLAQHSACAMCIEGYVRVKGGREIFHGIQLGSLGRFSKRYIYSLPNTTWI